MPEGETRLAATRRFGSAPTTRGRAGRGVGRGPGKGCRVAQGNRSRSCGQGHAWSRSAHREGEREGSLISQVLHFRRPIRRKRYTGANPEPRRRLIVQKLCSIRQNIIIRGTVVQGDARGKDEACALERDPLPAGKALAARGGERGAGDRGPGIEGADRGGNINLWTDVAACPCLPHTRTGQESPHRKRRQDGLAECLAMRLHDGCCCGDHRGGGGGAAEVGTVAIPIRCRGNVLSPGLDIHSAAIIREISFVRRPGAPAPTIIAPESRLARSNRLP